MLAPVQRMGDEILACVLLGERHHSLSEGVRGLLETTFSTVFMVADAASLLEGAARLQPALVVLDVGLAGGDLPDLARQLRECAPSARLLVLSVHDECTIASDALDAGADGIVVKSQIAGALLPAVDAILAGRQFFPTPIPGQ